MQKFRIPYIPYRSLLLSTTVLNDKNLEKQKLWLEFRNERGIKYDENMKNKQS